MPTTRLTTRSLEAFRKQAMSSGKAVYLWDTIDIGFGCRIAPSGQISWLVQKWFKDRGSQRERIGHFPSMSVDKAREYARGKINKAEAEKKDFVTQRTEAEREHREQQDKPTLETAANRYLDHRRNEHRQSYWQEVKRKFENELYPVVGKDTRLPAITEADLRKIVNAKRDAGHHVAARYFYVAIRPFFKWCVDEGYCVVSPLERIKCPKPPKDRERILSDDEVKAFWSATDKLEGPFAQYGPFYKLLLLTAQRREEVGAMQWAEINGSIWSIPGERTKNGKAHIVHMSPQALAILDELSKDKKGGYVFSVKGHKGEASISGYSKAKARLDKLMRATPAWRVHDLRRTAASGMARLGFQPYIVDRVLNHISDAERGMVRVYQRHKYLDERKRALEVWGFHVSQLVGISTEKTNVLPMKRKLVSEKG